VHVPGVYVDFVILTFDLLTVPVLGMWYFTATLSLKMVQPSVH